MEELDFGLDERELPTESGYYIYINGHGYEEVVYVFPTTICGLSMRTFSGREDHIGEAKGKFVSRIKMPSEE